MRKLLGLFTFIFISILTSVALTTVAQARTCNDLFEELKIADVPSEVTNFLSIINASGLYLEKLSDQKSPEQNDSGQNQDDQGRVVRLEKSEIISILSNPPQPRSSRIRLFLGEGPSRRSVRPDALPTMAGLVHRAIEHNSRAMPYETARTRAVKELQRSLAN